MKLGVQQLVVDPNPWLPTRGCWAACLHFVCCELPALRLPVAELHAVKLFRLLRLGRVSVLRVLLLAVVFTLDFVLALGHDKEHQLP